MPDCLSISRTSSREIMRQPLWPYCGFKFHFEEWFESSHFVMKRLNSNQKWLTDNFFFFSVLYLSQLFCRACELIVTPTLWVHKSYSWSWFGNFWSPPERVHFSDIISLWRWPQWQWRHWCLEQRCYIKTLVNTRPNFLTVPFVYWADRPQLNRKGLVSVWSINQKFVKHKFAPNEAFMQASLHHLWLNKWPQFIRAYVKANLIHLNLLTEPKMKMVMDLISIANLFFRQWCL